jgi:hypothetical protein
MRTGKLPSATLIISRELPGIVSCLLAGGALAGSAMSLGFEPLAQVAPADLRVPVLGQLVQPKFPLDDALESGPLEVVRLDTPLPA